MTTLAEFKYVEASMYKRFMEQIVAELHVSDDVTVKTNVFLPIPGSSRRREIDILIQGHLAGYPVRIAMECKNYPDKIGEKQVDQFLGALIDVGIPPSMGIMVSARGFTKDARERAAKADIRLLLLTGLSDDRLSSALHEASQSVVYQYAAVTGFSITTDVAKTDDSFQLFTYQSSDGKLQAMLPDIVWSSWHAGQIPREPGSYSFEVRLPNEWKVLVDGHECAIYSARIIVRVIALVYTLGGEMTRHSLSDPITGQESRWTAKATFDVARTRPQVAEFYDERALDAYLAGTRKAATVLHYVSLPRIRFNNLLWPPSERTYQVLNSDFERWTAAGRPIPRRNLSFEEVEGHFLQSMNEAILGKHQSVRQADWTEMLAATTKLKRSDIPPSVAT